MTKFSAKGEGEQLEISSSELINLHMAATCLHYGQEAFEGLKAFRGKDGKVRIFRLEENAARLQSTCRGIMMAELPTERFKEAVLTAVKMNERFIPPYESGASLYIRPLLIGTGAQVGVRPSNEYMFLIFVTPVGPYFKGGFAATPYVITRKYDRAAPLGTGIYNPLSQREKEIITCVVKGMTNKAIADQLYLSIHTVITHRRNIARKLQIHSPAGLTIYAIVNKLVELQDIKDNL